MVGEDIIPAIIYSVAMLHLSNLADLTWNIKFARLNMVFVGKWGA